MLPLVVDLTRPTPAVGWRNQECASFLGSGSRREFDLVMMLAVVHHMLVTERIPLEDLFALADRIIARICADRVCGSRRSDVQTDRARTRPALRAFDPGPV